ncbi:RNF122 [Symbiodinium necroappetens]|nr:RNF122 [Symbiodinium necroappetens]CAE7378758.1 RNF122 [Symbiodinium microadriaticum]CAE7843492.1 RNF122 [Symbiodinium sp. KB8]
MEELRRMESRRAAAIPADDLSGAPLSVRLLLASSVVLMILGLFFMACYAVLPSGAMVQELMFALVCMTFLTGSLSWMALVRCHLHQQATRQEEKEVSRNSHEHVWASMPFQSLATGRPEFRLMQVGVAAGTARPTKKVLQKADVLPTQTWVQQTCLCCLEDFKGPDVISLLPCGHIYHEACLMEWFTARRSSGSCPVCRQHAEMV